MLGLGLYLIFRLGNVAVGSRTKACLKDVGVCVESCILLNVDLLKPG